MAISRERGVELTHVYDRSINKQKFKMFLEELRTIHPYTDIMLMMDNLKLHKSNDIKRRMDDLGFLYTYTPVYSPQYNGVEEVISMAKRLIKNRRLELILTGEKEDLNKMILGYFN